MKTVSRLILIGLLTSSLSACTRAGNEIIKPETTTPIEMTGTQTKDTTGSHTAEGSTDAEDAVTIAGATTTAEQAKPEPVGTKAEETKAEEAKPTDTKTSEVDTSSTKTEAVETKPDQEDIIRSNISPEFQAELAKPENGVIIVYRPDLYTEIKAITKWDVVEFNTGTQLLLVTKEKGSRVEVSKSMLTDGEDVVIPGDVIRHWETTSDFEVIRILYSDPETMPFNFIRVIQPDGKKTTLPIHTSMRDNPEWETFQYDED